MDSLTIINFAHPLTAEQVAQVKELTGATKVRVIEVRAQLDPEQTFVEQVRALVDHSSLTTEEWQSGGLLVNLPSLSFAAALLLAELHGRMGHFPAVLRLRAVKDATPPQFEVAEIVNLQAIRDEARQRR
jgi:hypothetical protein